MLAHARKTAEEERLKNVEFRHADAQIDAFDRDSFDLVISRMGSMFFGDPSAAFANLQRALRSGGRLALLTWQPITANEWLTEFRSAFALGRDFPMPPPDAPSPFSLADPERVSTILGGAGFVEVSLQPLVAAMQFGTSIDDAFEFVSSFIGWMLEGLDDVQQRTAVTALRTSIAAHAGDHGITYEGATWIITARKP
jgi:SAM-dependent methyltransferase